MKELDFGVVPYLGRKITLKNIEQYLRVLITKCKVEAPNALT